MNQKVNRLTVSIPFPFCNFAENFDISTVHNDNDNQGNPAPRLPEPQRNGKREGFGKPVCAKLYITKIVLVNLRFMHIIYDMFPDIANYFSLIRFFRIT